MFVGPAANAAGLKVLFIGNSLTYVNDLPAMVAQISESCGSTNKSLQRIVKRPAATHGCSEPLLRGLLGIASSGLSCYNATPKG